MNFTKRYGVTLCLALGVSGLIWTWVAADKASTQSLGGADRYLTSVSTDKPIYRPSEKVYIRGVILNAANNKPLPGAEKAQAQFQIKGPKGDTIASGMTQSQESVLGFAWEIPDGTAGGEYVVKISYPWIGHAPAERKFDIRSYRAPRLKSQIVFLRDGYGPGERVSAALHTERAEGGIPVGAKVGVIARIDGTEVHGADCLIDGSGNCTATFDLSKEIARGEGTLALVIQDGGVVETASKTIPILLQTVDIKFYPEGGELVKGVSNRVYFEARQPNGKPADLSGVIETHNGQNGSLKLADFHTDHEGRGRFEFVPDERNMTNARITSPGGIKTTYTLPPAKDSGVILRTTQDTFKKGQPIDVSVIVHGEFAKLKVTLSKREVEVDMSDGPGNWSSNEKGHYSVRLNPQRAEGVLRVTVWDEKGLPLAERLIYREPVGKLNVTITPDKPVHVPGENVKLTIKTTDGDGKPVSAIVGITATDDSILEMIEKREQAARLPVMVLLEPELKELADAHVYLDDSDPKSSLALDLLLGTQGWRRFAFMDATAFVNSNGDAAKRVLAIRSPQPPQPPKTLGQGFGIAQPAMAGKGGEAAPDLDEDAAPLKKDENAAAGDALKADVSKAKIVPSDAAKRELPVVADEKPKNGPVAAAKPMPANGALRADKRMAEQAAFVVVREFAHQVRPDRNPNDRVDFSETLYWHAGIKTDAATGEATVSFGLNDSVTTFRVFADGFDTSGRLGANNIVIQSVQPFYLEPKLPLEVTSGDTILLPINVINAIASDLPGATLAVTMKGEFAIEKLSSFDLKPMDRARRILKIDVGLNNTAENIVITANAGPYSDSVTRKLSVKAKGFPFEVPFGGLMGPGKNAAHTITIPANVVPRSMTTHVNIYPTPLANMTEALERLIQDPSGCFEQTSSTSYPLTMAQQYFLNHTGVDPKVVERAREKLDAGYKRLVSFWCPDRGYEWFGENPGHEALTAFGVMHFSDMAQVRDVDSNMITTTRAWLLKQRDGKGGFERRRRALHTWIEDKDCSNSYIVWTLLESGEKPENLSAEINALKTAAAQSQNSYVLALAANVFALAGDKDEAAKVMNRLLAKQLKNGSIDGGTASIVGSGGEALMIETTALASLAWMRNADFAGAVENSLKFLADSCKAGRYGSTQSTVLALRAIVTYDKLRARPKAPGKVRVYVDGQSIGSAVAFDPTTQGAIKLPDLSELLTPGEHKIDLKMEGGGEMPYSVAVTFNALTPASSKDCKLDVSVQLANTEVVEGGITEANVLITNKTKDVLPTPIAIIGLPGGLEPRHDQLKELVKKGTIDAYEVIGREVVLYWRGMAAEGKVSIPLSLVAAVPGTYTGPASRAYLYYTDEYKQWIAGMKVTISPKQ